jgi:predicted DNA-binding transcriptional regulator AlpA
MTEHHFELTIKGVLTDELLDTLVDVGCDDATFSAKDDLTFASFDRDAPTLLGAIISAIRDIESVNTFRVMQVDPDELVWASEIAERTNRSRQSIDQLVKGQRGPGTFPSPASHSTRNPLWRWPEVEAWFETYEGRPANPERAAIVSAINNTLQARHRLTESSKPAALRKALQTLLTGLPLALAK